MSTQLLAKLDEGNLLYNCALCLCLSSERQLFDIREPFLTFLLLIEQFVAEEQHSHVIRPMQEVSPLMAVPAEYHPS